MKYSHWYVNVISHQTYKVAENIYIIRASNLEYAVCLCSAVVILLSVQLSFNGKKFSSPNLTTSDDLRDRQWVHNPATNEEADVAAWSN